MDPDSYTTASPLTTLNCELSRVEVEDIMDSKSVNQAIAKIKADSKKRKFAQTYDLIINLKDINIKKQEGQIDIYSSLPNPIGKKIKICGLVGAELYENAQKEFDKAIQVDNFSDFQGKNKEIKKLAEEYDFFVAQGDIMAKVAQVFGRVLGPKGKMPNPKAGCVVPPKANLQAIADKLSKTVRITSKKEAIIKIGVGKEDMDDSLIEANVISSYNTLLHALPLEKNNIKSVYIKLTMGKPIPIE